MDRPVSTPEPSTPRIVLHPPTPPSRRYAPLLAQEVSSAPTTPTAASHDDDTAATVPPPGANPAPEWSAAGADHSPPNLPPADACHPTQAVSVLQDEAEPDIKQHSQSPPPAQPEADHTHEAEREISAPAASLPQSPPLPPPAQSDADHTHETPPPAHPEPDHAPGSEPDISAPVASRPPSPQLPPSAQPEPSHAPGSEPEVSAPAASPVRPSPEPTPTLETPSTTLDEGKLDKKSRSDKNDRSGKESRPGKNDHDEIRRKRAAGVLSSPRPLPNAHPTSLLSLCGLPALTHNAVLRPYTYDPDRYPPDFKDVVIAKERKRRADRLSIVVGHFGHRFAGCPNWDGKDFHPPKFEILWGPSRFMRKGARAINQRILGNVHKYMHASPRFAYKSAARQQVATLRWIKPSMQRLRELQGVPEDGTGDEQKQETSEVAQRRRERHEIWLRVKVKPYYVPVPVPVPAKGAA